jgi:hypothetical protein
LHEDFDELNDDEDDLLMIDKELRFHRTILHGVAEDDVGLEDITNYFSILSSDSLLKLLEVIYLGLYKTLPLITLIPT